MQALISATAAAPRPAKPRRGGFSRAPAQAQATAKGAREKPQPPPTYPVWWWWNQTA